MLTTVNNAAWTLDYMTVTPGERLKALRDSKGLSQAQVSVRSEGEVSVSYLSKIESGAQSWHRVGSSVVRGLAKALNMSIDDLVDTVDGRSEITPHGQGEIVGRRVPVYDLVGAGTGLDGGTVIDEISIPPHWVGEFVAYVIEGDSMAPGIPPQSKIVVRRTQDIYPNQIIVAYVPEHGMVVKRYHHSDGNGVHVLTSDNPNHPPLFVDDFAAIGVVEEVRQKPK